MGFSNMLARLGVAVLIGIWASASVAQTQAGVTPGRVVAELGRNESIELDWRIFGGTGISASQQARSDNGVLLDVSSGQVLKQVPLALATTVPGNVREQLLLSRQDLDRAAALGATQLAYQRSWRDSSGVVSRASVRIALTSSQRSALQIRNLRLEFNNGAPELLVAVQGEDVRARAIINFAGRDGVLNYEWQLATPASTRSQARFYVLSQGQQNLRGRSPVVLESPALPSQLLGAYQLRFVVRSPELQSAELRYWVRAGASGQALAQQYPLEGAALNPSDVFSWRAVARASAYQLEIYRAQERIAGVLLPADSSPSTALPEVALKYLKDGCDCHWRVLAYDANGEVNAISELRRVRIQPQVDESPVSSGLAN